MDGLFRNYWAMRRYVLSITGELNEEEVRAIPEGAVNSILWNLGHVITDEVNMLYTPSGLASPLPDGFHGWFDPESSPRDWEPGPDVAAVRQEMQAQARRVQADYGKGRFAEFEAYSLSETYRLESAEEGIEYCALHEAMHIGVIITLIRMVTGRGVTH